MSFISFRGNGGVAKRMDSPTVKLTTWAMYSLLLSLALLLTPHRRGMLATAQTPPVEVIGYKFFEIDGGDSVSFKGVDYYPRPNTGILDKNNLDFYHTEYRDMWQRDIEYFKQLGINAIRLYAVDPALNHDDFMCALQEAGIYVMVGLASDCLHCSISNATAPMCYHSELKLRGQRVINAFSKYDNVMGFSAGNEVSLYTDSMNINAPCQKRFLRDMRKFIAECPAMKRKIPVGVVVADIDREKKLDYYNCVEEGGNIFDEDVDPYQTAEFFGLNAYQHCDGAVVDSSDALGFQIMKEQLRDYSIPVILTEYGCLNPSFPTVDDYEGTRTFLQAEWIYQEDFQDIFAGAFMFEYSLELANANVTYPYTAFTDDRFGVGYFSPVDCDGVNITCEYNPFPEFEMLTNAYAATSAVGVVNSDSFDYSDRMENRPCPVDTPKLSFYNWQADDIWDVACYDDFEFTCPAFIQPTAAPVSASSTAKKDILVLFAIVVMSLYHHL